MILYTMMPQELIFPSESDAQHQCTIIQDGVELLVETTSGDTGRIVRILSTDPQHYLDARFTPGTKISLLEQGGLSSF
ncbi:YlzJ-like family protein [Neobacillus sp. SM06]|uniref:YlzJ-like family protein n=1 Tax=Neobacillus sp. SM06 TaxID=3422492 RepID=UPI003D2822C8